MGLLWLPECIVLREAGFKIGREKAELCVHACVSVYMYHIDVLL